MHTTIPTGRASAALFSLLLLSSPASAGGGVNGLTERVLFQPDGSQLIVWSYATDLSADGRWAVVETPQALAPEDLNGVRDVYVLDLESGTTQLASINALGTSGNGESQRGRISDDGRYVVFQSAATNLIGLDSNGSSDVFRKDLVSGALVRVSNAGALAANGSSQWPDVSADGRYVVFRSDATNLAAPSTSGMHEIYWRDMLVGTVLRMTDGVFGDPNNQSVLPTISADGMRVAYASDASNLVLFDVNGERDVFVQDVGANPVLVSRPQAGGGGDGESTYPVLSDDGAYVVFHSEAANLVVGDHNDDLDVFRVELATDAVALVSGLPGSGFAEGNAVVQDLSADGRWVLFQSSSDDLTPDGVGQLALYLRDMQEHTTALISRPSGATGVPNGYSINGMLDADATKAVFVSMASNLVPGDTNINHDVFERTFLADPVTYCVSSTTSAGCTPQIAASGIPSASADSGFTVSASDLPNNKVGILFYSLQGSAQIPFLGGALCTGPLAGRSPALLSGGNPGVSDCSGTFTIDMNAFAAGLFGGLPHAALSLIGQQVNAQFWGRDPEGAVHTSFLSNALEYFVGP
jgi:Tol biopolymer transport system component